MINVHFPDLKLQAKTKGFASLDKSIIMVDYVHVPDFKQEGLPCLMNFLSVVVFTNVYVLQYTGKILSSNQCPFAPQQPQEEPTKQNRKASGVAAAAAVAESEPTVKSFDDIPSVTIPGGLPMMLYKFIKTGWKSVFDIPSVLHQQYFDKFGPIFK